MKRENEIVTVLGKKGGGKTSITLSLTNSLTRLVIFDYNREYEKGFIVTRPLEFNRELQKYVGSAFRFIYRPDDSLSIEEHFAQFSQICYAVPNYTLVVEEVDLVASAGFMPEGLQKIINYGRHKGINLVALSRRAFKVPRDLTSNSDKVYVAGPLNEPRDIKYLSDFMDSTDAEKVRTLKKSDTSAEFLLWQQEGVRIGVIDFLTKVLKEGILLSKPDEPAVTDQTGDNQNA